MDTTAADLVGDLAMLPGDIVDGWCWSPSRPGERLQVDLVIEGAVAARVEAAVFRRDLLLLRIGDGRHGFRLKLPPGALAGGRDSCLIEARERGSVQAFGRCLHERLDAAPASHAALDAAADALDGLGARLGPLQPPPSTALRRALRELAVVLPQAGVPGADVAAARALLDASGTAALPWLEAPRFTLALMASAATAAETALARLRSLAAVVGPAAEVVLVDPGHDARLALLPSLVANLRYAAGLGDAAAQARGDTLAVLDADAADASPAALAELLARPEACDAMLLGQRGDVAHAQAWPVAAPVGIVIAAPTGLFRDGDVAATLRAGLAAGLRCRVPTPPWRPPA